MSAPAHTPPLDGPLWLAILGMCLTWWAMVLHIAAVWIGG